MFYRAKNGCVDIGNAGMDYISFGAGGKNLIMIPGVGDGLKTAKGMAVPFALLYRSFARDYKVYVFSRRNALPVGFTTRDMAGDVKEAMDRLGIRSADILGVSQGGMIAQYLAIDYPEAVRRLVLAVTLSRPNETIKGVVDNWLKLARAGDDRGLLIDTAERSYTEDYLKKNRPFFPVMARMAKPKEFGRFIIQAEACVTHDSYGALGGIRCPTLVVGGEQDRVVGAEASRELAERIEDCRLFLYGSYGHGLYEEAKDFNKRVLDFLEPEKA